jgi:hypothetical protein
MCLAAIGNFFELSTRAERGYSTGVGSGCYSNVRASKPSRMRGAYAYKCRHIPYVLT